MAEEEFSDQSFIYYLIDNINQALVDSETDLNDFLTEIKEKLMKNYVKELKKNKKKENTMNLFKNLASILKKKSQSDIDQAKNSSQGDQSQKSQDWSMSNNDAGKNTPDFERTQSMHKPSGFDPKRSLFRPKSRSQARRINPENFRTCGRARRE